jgi:hypothetical protein
MRLRIAYKAQQTLGKEAYNSNLQYYMQHYIFITEGWMQVSTYMLYTVRHHS